MGGLFGIGRMEVVLPILRTIGISVLAAATAFAETPPPANPGAPVFEVSGQLLPYRELGRLELASWRSFPAERAMTAARADVDGDGLDDLLACEPSTGRLWVGVSNGHDAFVASSWGAAGFSDWWDTSDLADLDGDGRADILAYRRGEKRWSSYHPSVAGGFARRNLPFRSTAEAIESVAVGNTPAGRWSGYVSTRGGCTDPNATSFRAFFPATAEDYDFGALNCLDPSHRILGFLDLDRDGHRDILHRFANNSWTSVGRVWAQFPPEYAFDRGVVGDFNGDGLPDLIARGGGLAGWWLAGGGGTTAVERPFPFPGDDAPFAGPLAAGDFNGDGLSDVVSTATVGGRAALLLSRAGPGIPGAEVRSASGARAVSAGDGSYRLSGLGAGRHEISVIHPTWKATVSVRGLTLDRDTKGIHFLLDTDQAPPRLGQALDSRASRGLRGPFVCLGYNPGGDGASAKWGRQFRCPPRHAFYEVLIGPADARLLQGSCCPLPFADVLLDEHLFVEERCPPEYLVTGREFDPRCPSCSTKLRCTRVNTQRFLLAPPSEARMWGAPYRIRKENLLSLFPPVGTHALFPPALRYGIGRESYSAQGLGGCIGPGPGELYVGRADLRVECKSYRFSRLLYRGAGGDPPRGTPVKMYPDCAALENPFDPTTGCTDTPKE